MLRHDNVSSHVTRLTVEFLKQKHIKVIEYSSCSPDLAMCDFWLLFNLKKEKKKRKEKNTGCHFQSKNVIDEPVKEYF